MYKKKYSIENYIMNSRGSGNHANLVGEHCFYKKKVVFCHMNKQHNFYYSSNKKRKAQKEDLG